MEKKFNSDKFKKDVKHKRLIIDENTMHISAKKIGVSKSTLSRIENGKTPDMNVFVKILSWLDQCSSVYIK